MRRMSLLLVSALLFLMTTSRAMAVPFLQDWGFNVDGTTSYQTTTLTGFNFSGFDFDTGLGTITTTYTGMGTHHIGVLFDHDSLIDIFNEQGTSSGTAEPAGLTWEIGKPYSYDSNFNMIAYEQIYSDFENGPLLNIASPFGPDDVAMAIDRQFTLSAGETAYLTFTVSESTPLGFFLQQTDLTPDFTTNGNYSIYYSSDMRISATPVPEPSTFALVGSALAGLGLYARRRRNG